MSEETATEEDGQEPSMDEILTNIRHILTEEEEAELAAAKADSELDSDPVSGLETEAEPETGSPPSANPESESEPSPEPDTIPEPGSASQPEPASEPEPIPELESEPTPKFMPTAAPMPPAMEAMLELTPDMVASQVLSEPTAQASTDVLSELAAAILDRRDMAVDTSSRDMTLEGIVREMLKPVLREWLDRNLPYLIERLVKREIDLMVNRAERLED